MRPPFILLTCCLLLTATGVAAQSVTTPQLRNGERVRLGGPAVGNQSTRTAQLVDVRGDTLFVQYDFAGTGGDSVAVPLSGLTRLEVSAGTTRQTWRSAGIGALAGGVIGVLTAGDGSGTLPGAAATGNAGSARSIDRTASAFSGALLGALVGGVVGHFWKAERWEDIPIPRRASAPLGSP